MVSLSLLCMFFPQLMALYFLGLFLLIQLPSTLVAGSVLSISKDCGSNRLTYFESSDGYVLAIDHEKQEDGALVCELLDSWFSNGCFFRDPDEEAWGRIGKKHCGREFLVPTHVERASVSEDLFQKAGRKLMLRLTEDASIIDELRKNSQSQDKKESHKSFLMMDRVSLAVPGMFLISCTLVFPCFRAKRRSVIEHNILSRNLNSLDSASSFEVSSSSERIPGTPVRVPPSPSRFSMSSQVTVIGSLNLSVDQIIKATKNFSPSLMLGEGGSGTVYKGMLPDGQTIAIKRAKKEHFAALRAEFRNEVELLAKIEHRNLVRLLGYIDKGNELIVITEYVPNGTIREHLDARHGKILNFSERLEIAIDVAHGLTYLHLYSEKTIIHRDVKSTNILLTEAFRAKVADFGFARTGPTEDEDTHIMTKVKGTVGYLDPEYTKTYQLTPKSDVYSFGILLIEILSGRRPIEMQRTLDERITIRWAFAKYNEGNVGVILDPLLEKAVSERVVKKLLGLAFQCAAPTRSDRPDMKEVVEQLWAIRKEYGRSLGRV